MREVIVSVDILDKKLYMDGVICTIGRSGGAGRTKDS